MPVILEGRVIIVDEPFPGGLHSSNWKKRAQTLELVGAKYETRPEKLLSIMFACLFDQEPTVRSIAVHFLKKVPPMLILDLLKEYFIAKELQIRWAGLFAAETINESFLLPLLLLLDEKEPLLRMRILDLCNNLKKL